MYGHVRKLAEAEKAGIEAAGGSVDLYQYVNNIALEFLTRLQSLFPG